jgi:hypothetical protein
MADHASTAMEVHRSKLYLVLSGPPEFAARSGGAVRRREPQLFFFLTGFLAGICSAAFFIDRA